MNHETYRQVITMALVAVLLSSCAPETSTATPVSASDKTKVEQLIVRYERGAPPATETGAPWGSQCVTSAYAERLERGRQIGAGMRVIRLDPPVSPAVGRVIARQMAQCPYIEWAEADEISFSIPGEEFLSG